MRLFQALEKCFPEMRKHKDWLWSQHPNEYWTEAHIADLKEDMIWWITHTYLDEHGMIYQLFRMANYETKHQMASDILVWHIHDWNIEHKFEKLSQKDTSAAQE